MPYSTTHYFCGCHVVESKGGAVILEESIFCAGSLSLERNCKHIPVLKQQMAEQKRRMAEIEG